MLVRRPGTSRFVALDGRAGIPVGSTVDARNGEVFLTSIPRAGAAPERAKFWDGIFKVTQSRGITTLTLTEQLAPCSSKARAAQKKKPKTRKLWGDGKGSSAPRAATAPRPCAAPNGSSPTAAATRRTRVTVGAS